MQDKLFSHVQPVLFKAVLWLFGITLLLLLRDAVELFTDPIDDGWLDLDLALVLIGYLLLFVLEPIRSRINRRLRKRTRRQQNRHRS